MDLFGRAVLDGIQDFWVNRCGFSKHGFGVHWACVSPNSHWGYQWESSGQTKEGTSSAGSFTSAGATLPFSPGRGHCPRLSLFHHPPLFVSQCLTPSPPLCRCCSLPLTALFGAARHSANPTNPASTCLPQKHSSSPKPCPPRCSPQN